MTPEGSYSIVIERGLWSDFQGTCARFGLHGQQVIVTNTTLQRLYPLTQPFGLMLDGERYKTLNTVEMLYTDFAALGVDRKTRVIAFGGGVVGDTAGFAAATYLRGLPFVQVPTSLLAMVDSSVGGKVGVDLPQGKNLVGAFKQPEWVFIDPDLLQTLPPKEWRGGMAEVIKHGLLADARLLDPQIQQDPEMLISLAIAVKIAVVQRDPYEQGERAHLNLGHTFGHAIELVTGYQWTHGEAVGVGLIAAARLSELLGLCEAGLAQIVYDQIETIGLPTRITGLDPERIYAAMATDKKWLQGRSRFVLLRGIAQPIIVEEVAKSAVIEVLKDLQA
jgi:3-dehydroquinate synthase